MTNRRLLPLRVAADGLAAGMAGALALTLLAGTGRSLVSGRDGSDPSQAVTGISAGEALADGPDMPPDMNRVTATFVQKLATGLFGASLDADQRRVAGSAWHLAYGGFWGMLYGLLQSSVGVPGRLLGPAYGLAVWTVGPGWLVPKMKLMLPPGKQQPRTTVMVIGVHTAYGAIVALVFRLLQRGD